MGRLSFLAACALGLPWSGCQWAAAPTQVYETIEANPRRDTAAAIKHNDAALKAMEHGHWPRAENLLQRALIADVTFAPAHNNLGHLYFVQKKFYHAAWEFEYAARLMPDRPEPLNNLGLVYEAVQKYPLAVEQYQQAVELAPQNQEFASNLARVRIRQGDRDFETASLLEQVAFRDDRGEWRDWAQEQLHTTHLPIKDCFPGPSPDVPLPSTMPWEQKPGHPGTSTLELPALPNEPLTLPLPVPPPPLPAVTPIPDGGAIP